MNARHNHRLETIEGKFEHPIYSPKGGVEGALLRNGEDQLQFVFEPHGGSGADAFSAIRPGDAVVVEGHAEPPSDKGEPAHAVYRFERLVSVNGRKPAKPIAATDAAIRGTVVRLNYARHGEANGVVLDAGHFIHTKPDGMAKLKLKVGDRIEANGVSRPLSVGGGMVIEAISVNGKAVIKHTRNR